jgi:hypothetical protein
VGGGLQLAAQGEWRVAQRAVDRRRGSGKTLEPAQSAEARSDVPERTWPIRRRFFFILTAATLCWVVPAVIAYLLLVGR